MTTTAETGLLNKSKERGNLNSMTWEIVVGLITLVGALVSLGTVLAKLVCVLTRLDDTSKSLKNAIEQNEKRNQNAHDDMEDKLEDHENRLDDHESRIVKCEAGIGHLNGGENNG